MSQTLAPWIVLGYAAADPPDFAAVITNITTGLQPVFLPIAGLSLTVFGASITRLLRPKLAGAVS